MNDIHYIYIKSGRRVLRTMFVAAVLLLCGSAASAGVRITGSVYGGGNQANVGETEVNMKAGEVTGSVYGGGNLGDVEKDVKVNMTGGTVDGDVYGGGALANTNVSNATSYDGTGTEANSFNYKTAVSLTGGTIKGDAYGGGLGRIGVVAADGVKYTQEEIDDAAVGDPAYGKTTDDWKVEPIAGAAAVKALVYGDVTVNLGSEGGSSATAFWITNYTGDHSDVVKSGRVFGCNNLNGYPLGNVTVTVYKTVKGNILRTEADDEKPGAKRGDAVERSYEVAAVYGGGNLADYDVTGKTAFVRIMTCDVSVESVYGGGNAAAVPRTEVLVNGAYELQYVFGGGNGKDPWTIDGGTTWTDNAGANIKGDTYVTLQGGFIHEAYGGSNEKGTIQGSAHLNTGTGGDCDLDVLKLVGAGKNADIQGDVIFVLGCMPEAKVNEIYGGADNANVEGNVELTITSGNFGQVFGGNNRGGIIKGHIKLNIEETGCRPINIDELYLGGNLAPYSVYGYNDDETCKTSGERLYDDPVLNVISFTHIGEVYGGGLGEAAILYGNPEVNINQTYGKAYVDDDPAKAYTEKATTLGTIGDIYGGGNEAKVVGNTAINIGTATTVGYVTQPEHLGTLGTDYTQNETTKLYEATVAGANITGNIYGGGNQAVVTGDTRLAVCAVKGEGDTYTSIADAVKENVSIDGAVFGAGKGETTDAANTRIIVGGGAVGKSVYGGGELGSVTGSTRIDVMDGTIGDPEKGGAEFGNVYGGGQGEQDATKPTAGLIKGNTAINISGGTIYHNIYGGGAYGSVGTYTYDEGTGATICADNTGDATITITGGTIGTDGKENGMVFGSSRGDVAKPTGEPARDPNDYLAWVNNTHVTIGLSAAEFEAQKANEPYKSYGTYESYKTTGAPHVKGSVYGSGENGHTYQNTEVIIHSGTIGITDTSIDGGASYALRGNVYGGGCGTDKYDSNNDGTPDTYNPWSGIVQRNATVLIDGGLVVHNVYGAGAMGSVEGGTSVTIAGGTVGVDGTDNGFVYAAAKGDEALAEGSQAHVGTTELNISGGTVWGSAFGGGQAGIVKKAVTVSLTGGEVKHDVYGGGALARTNTQYDGTDETYKTYVTNVTLAGATIAGDLYGGGLGSNTVAADVKGPVTVAVSSGSADRLFGCNNVNGAPQSTVTVNVSGGTIGNAYGGGNQATYSYTNADSPQNLQVNISGGTIGNVFGGGLSAEVAGGIDVNITGGTVTDDVYGGGALANTNTANWDFSNTTKESYYLVSGLKAGTSSVDGLYYKQYVSATGTAVAGTTYYKYEDGEYSVVSVSEGANVETYYIMSDSYTSASGTAVDKVWYYRRVTDGDWAAGKNEGGNTTYKTNVTLTGGTVGNVYGGGLGQIEEGTEGTPSYKPEIAPNVYGDITVTVNKADGTGTARFSRTYENHSYMGTYKDSDGNELTGETSGAVYSRGCVFGANNKKGTPKGSVQVTVWTTTPDKGKEHEYGTYEVQNVYGGGNLSAYEPGEGKSTHVDIHGCGETSIQFVFGGGNAAAVPESHVTIWGSYEIETVFGGGNGSEPIWSYTENKWVESPGAMVGISNVTLKGGYLHSAFGGSYERGVVGTIRLDKAGTGEEGCPLQVTDMFGGGKDADVKEDINIIISDCGGSSGTIGIVGDDTYVPPTDIKNVYAGSYNARIFGNVTMTVTGGDFTNVFGGNHTSGFINGKITVNIEETKNCGPVIIENLYGGGNYAAYPGLGHANPDPKITVNVKAATRIGNIYGGSNHADVTGDTEININMIKGWWAGKTYTNSKKSINIPDSIGTIGNVYGGGNEGKVIGSTFVNIGTQQEIELVSTPESDPETSAVPTHMVAKANGKFDVLGAKITGDVFGGCNLANVERKIVEGTPSGGNTTVNICTADYSADDPETDGYERVSIGGSVYGGGNRGDVLGNTSVTMEGGNRPEVDGAYVFDGVYGGGLRGSVGTVTSRVLPDGHPTHAGCLGGKPDAYADSTGTCTVVVSGGQVGPVEVALDGGGMKNTKRYFKATGERNGPVDYGFVFGAGRGEVEDPYSDPDVDFHTYVKETDVTISGTALVMASVYGGGENGRVRGDTWVKIQGGQIGCGEGQKETVNGVLKPKRYDDSQFINPIGKTTEQIDAAALDECPHWDYGKVKNGVLEYLPYDPLYFEPLLDEEGEEEEHNEADEEGADGHTYYGNVFGGGSGYYPYEKANKGEKKHDWLRSAGWVEGNTTVDITGGHILTNVYGGNETTDVGGKCTINMSGGTIGVPRTLAKIAEHPVTCYLFGAGKGDQRTHFNTWTNVNEVVVNVTGGIIYGSVFGGGEDGHVLGDVKVKIEKGAAFTVGDEEYTNGPIIGTWGTSYVDGNVFGGGRGFSGEALTAGSIGGNVTVNITGGKMLGSVYGGGRLASVGIGFTEPDDPAYGQLISDGKRQVHQKEKFTLEDAPGAKHGYITINISGDAKIGTTTESGSAHPVGGNVFGGSMGRIDLLDGSPNPLWPKLAVVKESKVTINGGEIMNSVYGGSEYGIVRDLATVDIKDGIVHGNVFGGGYGHDDERPQTISVGQYTSPSGETTDLHVTFTPMQWTGCVSGDTEVNIKGGTVEKNVYGGGDLASVGLIDHYSDAEGNYNNIVEHKSATPGVPYDGFDLSWPYKFTYIAGNPDSDYIGGKATVSITGGRIGKAGDENSGYVFGGSKGRPMERYHEAHFANVRETKVTIDDIDYDVTPEITNAASAATYFGTASNPGIQGAVYGGGEDGHVYENASVEIKGGIIGYSVYAGGKGINKYSATLKNRADNGATTYETEIYSITAGKVYGNTSLTMTGGHVVRNVYGGGFMASVGKGNYAGGADDYSSVDNFNYNGVDMGPMCGYGEYITGNLWDKSNANSIAFLESGKATIKITGGIIGTPDGTYDELPTGNVVGGSRGEAAPNVFNMPVHDYNPTFHVGNINEAEIIIGTEGGDNSALHIYGSVYGGGQDGHMRRDAKVTVYSGEIGKAYTSGDQNDPQWKHRGNVYGSGSGIGQFEFDYDGNGSIDPNDPNETGLSFLAGCVARFSEVDIQGGIIHRNVYGGGSLAGTGMPKFYRQDYEPYKKGDTADGHGAGKQSQNTVSISGGTIGQEGYGGNVFGASRGEAELVAGENPMFATSIWTEVKISGGTIYNNVYGGGELGTVKQSTHVNLLGGEIKHEAYGGGRGIKTADGTGEVEANIGGDATVILNNNNNGADADGSKKGCIVEKIYGCNDQNGSPKGSVLVHVYATQHAAKDNISTKVAPPEYSTVKGTDEAYAVYLKRVIDVAKPEGTVLTGLDPAVITSAEGVYTTYKNVADDALTADNRKAITDAARSVVNQIESLHDYDVLAVYGGGNLAAYEPTDAYSTDASKKAAARAHVIIEGCDVTSIKQVYGGGNAASAPATDVEVRSAFVIDELFGGGNGMDNYTIGDKHYENPGANVGYKLYHHYVLNGTQGTGAEDNLYKAIPNDGTDDNVVGQDAAKAEREAHYAYGTGQATTTVTGGHIHYVYGGSNIKGNIRTLALSQYQKSGSCLLVTDETYGGSKSANIDAEVRVVLDCVEYGGTYFGGSQNANINNNVTLDITNGTYDRIFGGNNQAGTINGTITINIEEKGCTPIIIGELYGGGYLAPYSIYGYKDETEVAKNEDGTDLVVDGKTIYQKLPYYPGETGALATPHRSPHINIISATSIGSIYGGGYKAKMIADPRINVNMTEGRILSTYKDKEPSYATSYTVATDGTGDLIIPLGTLGNIYGGGNEADVIGNTYVEIGTGEWRNAFTNQRETKSEDGTVYTYNSATGMWDWNKIVDDVVTSGSEDEKPAPFRNRAKVTGNVYGGGRMGHVGYFTLDADGSNSIPDGKPVSCADGTGSTHVTISNGEIGPDGMQMTASGGPDDFGHVFGGGQGTCDLLYDVNTTGMTEAEKLGLITDMNPDDRIAKQKLFDNMAYVNNSEVIIDGTAFVKGSVYGGGFDGHVLGDTHVTIDGDCQIGCGQETTERHPAEVWEESYAPSDEVNLECASWPYTSPYAPHDKFAGVDGYDAEGGAVVASDGHTFYGNVFGGGSGYFPYAPGEWNHKAGWVEGNTTVEIKGGHILTNVYGGNEMTNVGSGLTAGKGKCTVRMTGGTLGVPRTLRQIAAHPVTCYLFGAGKGDQIVNFNTETNVKEVEVDVSGGRIYGSVFGGGEDGHVLGDVKMTIRGDVKIGTWGTSYVDGNVFGGGRGFSGQALTAGNVGGSVKLDIQGGTMLGSVYGGGRLGSVGYGLYAVDDTNYGVMRDDDKDDAGSETDYFTTSGMNKLGRGFVDISITGGTIGNTNEYRYIAPDVADDALTTATAYMPNTVLEADNRLKHTKGGNVFAGAMGRRTDLTGAEIGNWTKLGNVKTTRLNVGGDAWIMGNVYGGGEFGAVTGSHTVSGGTTPAGTEIIITGGTIGTEITSSPPQKETIPVPAEGISDVKYTFGSVYGGGYGTEDKLNSDAPTADAKKLWNNGVENLGAFVTDSTYISMSGGAVRGSVFGGGEVAAVGGSSHVSISGGKIGRGEVKPKSDPDDPGYVLFGGATMGNVYGGGKGTNLNPLVGVVQTNTNVSISAGTVEGEPFIYHNVYGGGALGSVGKFHPNNPPAVGFDPNNPSYVPVGVPYGWTKPDYSVTDQNGIAKVTITGGTIGISGRDNGMVNGSSRGDVAVPEPSSVFGSSTEKDPYDRFAYVNKSYVTIGTEGSATGPVIKGSVYGGGENGHNNNNATVTMYSGTVGILEGEDWFDYGNPNINKKAMITRGNVYGAGCGTDTYEKWDDKNDNGVKDEGETMELNNPWSGSVSGNTFVNIHGGLVTHNVYGGGSMGSVGVITEDLDFEANKDKFKLSWPCIFTYKPDIQGSNGHSTVNIYGGRIGTTGSDNGDVFGGARGKAGDATLEVMHPGSVKTATVNISFEPSVDAVKAVMEGEEAKIRIDLKDGDEKLVNAIAGSVYGGGEDGLVYENTSVTMTNGLVGHSIYGGGKGKGTYTRKLKYIVGGAEYKADTYSIHSGKVYGNTSVAMADGLVLRNIYGGGNMGSVGKGNYSGGKDDYSTSGYGETLTGNLWDGKSDDSNAFLNSGKTSVTITGGTVGYIDSEHPEASYKDGLPYGNVFGGCRGEAAPVVPETDETPRYLTCPAFFTGYVNETDVNIGKESDEIGPTILGTVYGGGEDGHVRRSTHIKVYGGTIGLDFTEANQARVGSTDINAPGWLYRGNVYGAGSGIGEYAFDFDGNGKTNDVIPIGGLNYSETGFSQSSGSVTHFTRVDVLGGTVYRNVAGGGSLASVGPPKITQPDYAAMIAATDYSNPSVWGTRSLNLVNIGGLKPTEDGPFRTVNIGSLAGVAARYGGNVFGGSRGEPSVGSGYASSIWTLVNVGHGSVIHGNVFGGGNAGEVLKDTKVVVGEE